MKKIVIVIAIILLTGDIFSQTIIPGEKYTQEEISNLKNYSTVYEVKLRNRVFSLIGENSLNTDYLIAILKDNKGNLVDALGLAYLKENLSFVDNDCICLTAKFPNSSLPNNGFLYVNSESNSIKVYDAKVMIMSVIATDNYIVYTTDKHNHCVWKVSLLTGNTTWYDDWFPGAPLYPLNQNLYIAYLEKDFSIGSNYEYIWHDPPLQYVITETEILPADKEYPRINNKTIADFYVENSE